MCPAPHHPSPANHAPPPAVGIDDATGPSPSGTTRPSPDNTSRPSPDNATGPSPDNATGPAPDRATASSHHRAADPSRHLATAPALRRQDFGRRELYGLLDTGSLRRLRRDTYVRSAPDAPSWRRQAEEHAAVLHAIITQGVTGVVALESAAILHGGRCLSQPAHVDLVVTWNDGGLRRAPTRLLPDRPPSRDLAPGDRRRALRRRPIVRHRFDLEPDDVVELGSLRLTGLERTIEDCARFLEPDRALAVVDSLFAVAVGAGDRPWDRRAAIDAAAGRLRMRLLERLAARRGERGVRRARAVINTATPWSQSVWESELRRLCLVHGLLPPEPQMPVGLPGVTYYVDLGWRSEHVAVEVDGEIKYAETPAEVLAAQVVRQERIEAQGFEVVRLTPAEVRDGGRALEALRNALPLTASEGRPLPELRTPRERRAALS